MRLQPGDATAIDSAWFDVNSPDQIRHRDRVRDLAEVYTHPREVNAMLDLVPDMFPTEADPDNLDKTFLEPAVGHGNFLVEILRRKLATVTIDRLGVGERFEHRILRCLTSIYGIDVDRDNVEGTRRRLYAVIAAHVGDRATCTDGFWSAVDVVLSTNIVRADTLADAAVTELVAYEPGPAGTFIREWSTLDESTPDSQLGLFDILPDEPRRDAMPVHYTQLASNPKPVDAQGRQR